MRIFWYLILSMTLAGMTWLDWQARLPVAAPKLATPRLAAPKLAHKKLAHKKLTHKSLPPALPDTVITGASAAHQKPVAQSNQLWRVITHRVMSKEGIGALQNRLTAMGLQWISIESMEDITMHAFDDAILFKNRAQARTIAKFWQQHGIETNIIKAGAGVYLLGLGRLYQAKYAEDMQKQLDQVGRKYRYQQRLVPIPVRRFTFAASDRKTAEALWKKLNATGVMMPLLMSETQFQSSYGDSIQSPAPRQSALRQSAPIDKSRKVTTQHPPSFAL